VLLVGTNECYVYACQIFVASVDYTVLICAIDSKMIALIVVQNETFV